LTTEKEKQGHET